MFNGYSEWIRNLNVNEIRVIFTDKWFLLIPFLLELDLSGIVVKHSELL